MKNLQNLKGAKTLNKKEQQSINGGAPGGESGCYSNQYDCLGAPCHGTCNNFEIANNDGTTTDCWKCDSTGWKL